MATLTKEIAEAAIEGLEHQKRRIDGQIAELRTMLNDAAKAAPAASKPAKSKRKFSAQALQHMREAQRRRRAKPGESVEVKAAKPKRRLSAAGRKAIVDALKKRWAAKKAKTA